MLRLSASFLSIEEICTLFPRNVLSVEAHHQNTGRPFMEHIRSPSLITSNDPTTVETSTGKAMGKIMAARLKKRIEPNTKLDNFQQEAIHLIGDQQRKITATQTTIDTLELRNDKKELKIIPEPNFTAETISDRYTLRVTRNPDSREIPLVDS